MPTAITSLAKAADRTRLIFDIRKALDGLEVAFSVTSSDSRGFTLHMVGPKISAMVDVRGDSRASSVPLIHWHSAKGVLGFAEAWGDHYNRFHGSKATSFPDNFPALLQALVAGFRDTRDGFGFLIEYD
jgi:hypothetical protein